MAAEVSTIIPTFRRPAQLRQAAASVLAQRDVEVELIIVDDSPEGSARDAVASLNDRRVTYILNPRPTGGTPAIVRNLALPEARGKFIHFLDDDDIVPHGHYLAVRQAFADHPEVGMVFGRIEPFGDCPPEQLENEKAYFRKAADKAATCQRLGNKWGFVAEMLFGRALLVCSAAVVRRECVLRVNGFDPAIRLMEDADYNIRVMREFGALFLDKTVLHYRIGSPSLMHNPDRGPAQAAEERDCCRKFRAKYRADRGSAEFFALAALCRGVLKVMP
jgi:GT2 family glycosyltransferase